MNIGQLMSLTDCSACVVDSERSSAAVNRPKVEDVKSAGKLKSQIACF